MKYFTVFTQTHTMLSNQTFSSALPDCATDPVASLKDMFVDRVMMQRINAGQCPARRAVFLKPHGIAKADFIIMPGLPPEYRVGIFAGTQYEAWVRFSSDTVPGRSDRLPEDPSKTNTVGVGIKLFNVPGKKLLPGDEDGVTADFLLQNMDVFFVDTARDMCEFTKASVVDNNLNEYLAAHPVTKMILDQMKKKVGSCLSTKYWSTLPYAFGDRLVKYKLDPVAPPFTPPASQNNANYLAADLQARLNMAEAQFNFMVQFSTDPVKMPADKATVRWSETESPPVQLATLVIRQQDISVQGQSDYGDNLSYNPWRTLKEHEPKGSLNEARRTVYKAGADLRHYKNGISSTEPRTPRQLDHP